MSYIETMADREVLKYAVQRAIFYPHCGHLADVRTAVLVSYTHTEQGQHVNLFHEDCINFDKLVQALETEKGIEAFEVSRGKELFK